MLEFDEASHIYKWNGEIVPSVNQILKFGGLIQDYSGVDETVLEYARNRGVAVDMAITLYHSGMLDESSLDPVIKPYFRGLSFFPGLCEAQIPSCQKKAVFRGSRLCRGERSGV